MGQSRYPAGLDTVNGNMSVGGNLAVTGTSVLTGNVTMSGTAAITGNTTVGGTLAITGATTCAALTASGLITANGGITLGASDTLTVPGTGIVNMATGAQLQANGTQASHIADASTSHSSFSDADADALGAKINAILVVLEGIGATATS